MATKVTPGQLRAARERAGLTQKEAAALCGVDERTYQRWELGEVKRLRSVYLERIGSAPKKRGV